MICQSVGDHSNSDNIALLSTVSSDPAKLEQELQCWQTGRCLQYSVSGTAGLEQELLTHPIASDYFVESGGFYIPHAEDEDVAEHLHAQGHLAKNNMGGYALSKATLADLSEPKPICSLRPNLALVET